MKKFFLLPILFLVIVASCSSDDDLVNQNSNNQLLTTKLSFLENSWTQSYEEETSEEIKIYRPSDYKKFPLSWYRQIFNFHENNVCKYLVLAANDAHYMESGKWEYFEETNTIIIFNSNSEILNEFEVVEIKNDLLKLKTKKIFIF